MRPLRHCQRSAMWSVAIALAVSALPIAPLASQTTSNAVSRELISVLLSGINLTGRTANIDVGVGSARLPAGIFPANATILGSISFGWFDLTVATSDLAPARAIDTVTARLRAQGFTPPVPVENDSRTGFFSGRAMVGAVLCRSPELAGIAVDSTSLRSTMISVVVTREVGTDCNRPPAVNRPAPTSRDPMPAPSLPAPRNSIAIGNGGMSRGGDQSGWTEMQSSATLRTRLSVTEIQKHYSELLRAAGWTQMDSATTSTAAVSSFEKPDINGAQWRADIFISVLSQSEGMTAVSFVARRRR